MTLVWRTIAGAAAGVVIIALLLSGAAQAVTDTVFKYSAAKNGWYGLSTLAFAPSNTATTNNTYSINSGSIQATGGGCFNAPVNLPHAAKMTTLTVQYAANTSGGVTANLYRVGVGNGTGANIASLASTDTSQSRTLMSGSVVGAFSTVNNQQYVYGLQLCLNGSGELYYAGRITYTYTNAGD